MTIKQAKIIAGRVQELNKVFPFLNFKPTKQELTDSIRRSPSQWWEIMQAATMQTITQRAPGDIFNLANDTAVLIAHPEFCIFYE